MWPNEDMHCRDRHCCTMSHQEGEISPRQEKSESNNTQQTQRRKSLEYIGSSINTISLFQAEHAGKPSVTFLNNSPSIFVITMTLLQMCGEKSVESAEGSIVENVVSWGFYFKKAVPSLSPCRVTLNSEKWGNCNSRHKENINASIERQLAGRLRLEECEDFEVRRAFHKSVMTHRVMSSLSVRANTCASHITTNFILVDAGKHLVNSVTSTGFTLYRWKVVEYSNADSKTYDRLYPSEICRATSNDASTEYILNKI